MIDLAGATCALLLLSFISIGLNSFCLHLMRSNKTYGNKPSNLLLSNLLATHLFQGVVVLPMYVGKMYKGHEDLFWIKFFSNGFLFSYLLAFYAVCMAVLLISVDRFLATYLLNKYKVYVTLKNAVIAIAISWLYIFVLCLLPFVPTAQESEMIHLGILFHGEDPTSKFTTQNNMTSSISNMTSYSMINVNLTSPNANLSNKSEPTPTTTSSQNNTYLYIPQKEWTVFMLFFNAALPFLLILTCYSYVIYSIKKLDKAHARRRGDTLLGGGGGGSGGGEDPKEFQRYKKLTYLTLVLSTIYFVLWTPSIVYYTLLHICGGGCFPEGWEGSVEEKHVVFVIKYLSYLNMLFSPAIYCLRNPQVKRSYEKISMRLYWKSKRSTMCTESTGF